MLAFSLAVASLTGCDARNNLDIPYFLKGLNVWVHNNKTDQNIHAGRIKARYWNRTESLHACRTAAKEKASKERLRDWSYVCCTVTSSSDCLTKVQ